MYALLFLKMYCLLNCACGRHKLFNTFLYSALVVVLLWKLDFAKNIYLRTQQERFVPLMASAIFYFWNFYVHHRNPASPKIYNEFLLSTFVLISVLFMLTIFYKISLHSTAISGALTFLIIAKFSNTCISWPILGVAIVVATLVMLARLQLKEHTKFEVISGAIVGALVQLACYAFYIR
jgi:membrane-associated phospholipid phosphatase